MGHFFWVTLYMVDRILKSEKPAFLILKSEKPTYTEMWLAGFCMAATCQPRTAQAAGGQV